MKFEIGKKYAHGNSKTTAMAIVGEANTRMWGNCLIGETDDSELRPIGKGEDDTQNWVEISEEEYREILKNPKFPSRCSNVAETPRN